jgi:hypothetical protein
MLLNFFPRRTFLVSVPDWVEEMDDASTSDIASRHPAGTTELSPPGLLQY